MNITDVTQKIIFVIIYRFLPHFLSLFLLLLADTFCSSVSETKTDGRFHQTPETGFGFVNGSGGFTETATKTNGSRS